LLRFASPFRNKSSRTNFWKALHRALEVREYQGILKSTIGVAFLGTPFQGSHNCFYTATQLRVAVVIHIGGEVSNELVKYLKNDASGRGELDELVQRFCEIVQNDDLKFPMICFYETQRLDFSKVVRDLPPQFTKQLDSNNTGIVSLHFTSMWLALTPIARPAEFRLPSRSTPACLRC
jgi:hypothetical protein